MTSQQVAILLGLKRVEILRFINDSPHLRPKIPGRGGYQWSAEEVENLRKHLVAMKTQAFHAAGVEQPIQALNRSVYADRRQSI